MNEPAFPCVDSADSGTYTGMTLRDYFAAQAMAVIIAGKSHDEGWGLSDANKVYVSREAYQLADEMLVARGQKV